METPPLDTPLRQRSSTSVALSCSQLDLRCRYTPSDEVSCAQLATSAPPQPLATWHSDMRLVNESSCPGTRDPLASSPKAPRACSRRAFARCAPRRSHGAQDRTKSAWRARPPSTELPALISLDRQGVAAAQPARMPKQSGQVTLDSHHVRPGPGAITPPLGGRRPQNARRSPTGRPGTRA